MNIKKLNEELETILNEETEELSIEDKIQELYEIQRKISIYSAYVDDVNYDSKKLGYNYKFSNDRSYNDMKSRVDDNHNKINDFENKLVELKQKESELTAEINNDLISKQLMSTDLFISSDIINTIVKNLQEIIVKLNRQVHNIYGSSPINLTITRVEGNPVLQFEIPYLKLYRPDRKVFIKDTNDYSSYNIEFLGTQELNESCFVLYKQQI